MQQLRDARPLAILGPLLEPRHKADIALDCIVRKKPGILDDVADSSPERDRVPIERRAALDSYGASRGLEQAIDKPQRGRFARAAPPQ